MVILRIRKVTTMPSLHRISLGQSLGSWLRWYNSFIVRRKKPLELPELERYFANAQDHYNEALAKTESQWQLSRYRWRFDKNTSCLYFTHNKGHLPDLIAQAQVLASHFISTHEWHWAWSTSHIPAAASKDARRLRSFGRCWGQSFLYTATLNLQGSPHQAPAFAALAQYLCEADSVYQGQGDQQVVYFLIRNLRCLKKEQITIPQSKNI